MTSRNDMFEWLAEAVRVFARAATTVLDGLHRFHAGLQQALSAASARRSGPPLPRPPRAIAPGCGWRSAPLGKPSWRPRC